MPLLALTSNVKPADLQAFVVEFSKLSAELLGKPEKYINVDFRHNETLSFAGTFDPAFRLEIISIGNINPTANEKYSAAYFAFLKEKLGVPGDRGYILFSDPGRAALGHDGTTVAKLFGSAK